MTTLNPRHSRKRSSVAHLSWLYMHHSAALSSQVTCSRAGSNVSNPHSRVLHGHQPITVCGTSYRILRSRVRARCESQALEGTGGDVYSQWTSSRGNNAGSSSGARPETGKRVMAKAVNNTDGKLHIRPDDRPRC
jgi:hypothetical protein